MVLVGFSFRFVFIRGYSFSFWVYRAFSIRRGAHGLSSRAGDTLQDRVGLPHKVGQGNGSDQVKNNATFFSPREPARLFLTGTKGLQGRLEFATLAFTGDDAEHPPDILLGFEVLLAFPFPDHAADQAPADQLAQVLVRVAAADLEILHDLIRGQGPVIGHEQGVDLGHGAIDAPGTAHRAPLGDKFITGKGKRILGFFFAHIFNKY